MTSTEERLSLIRRIITELTPENIYTDYHYAHFQRQSDFIYIGGERVIEHIFPVFSRATRLEPALQIFELPPSPTLRLNSGSTSQEEYLRPDIKDFVRLFYNSDFDMIGSFDHLAPLLFEDCLSQSECNFSDTSRQAIFVRLTTSSFRFLRSDGTVIAENLILLPSGSFSNLSSENEEQWQLCYNELLFINHLGAVTTRFSIDDIGEVDPYSPARLVIVGDYLPEGLIAWHTIEENLIDGKARHQGG